MQASGMSWELIRKTAHLSGFVIVLGYTLLLNYVPQRLAILALTVLLLILLEVEHVRLEHKPKILKIVEGIFRKREEEGISGAAFMVISCIICFAAYDYWVAVVALFMTVFGDLASALFGKAFGRIVIVNGKTLVGACAGFVVNSLVGMFILPEQLVLTTAMALTASVVEIITNKLDDNLTVPLFAGIVGQIIVYFNVLDLGPIGFHFFDLF